MDKQYLTAEQIASQLRVTARTVRAWSRGGLIPSIRLTPKVVRYDLNEVVTALQRSQELKRKQSCTSQSPSKPAA